MAPRTFTTSDERLAAILNGALRITGGADDEPPADPPPADPPAADAAPVEGAPPADSAPEAAPLPALPEGDITTIGADDLRTLFDNLSTTRASLLETATTAAELDDVERLQADRVAIRDELQRRADEAVAVAERRQAQTDADEVELPAQPVLASVAAVTNARGTQPAAAQQPPANAQPDAVHQPLLASAGIANVGVGDELSLERLGEEITRLSRTGGEVYQEWTVATLPAYVDSAAGTYPDALDEYNVPNNDRLIREAQAAWDVREAARLAGESGPPQYPEPLLAAAGGPCTPFDIMREIPDAFSSAERISPIWPQRPVGRGGLVYTLSGSLSDVSAGFTNWFDANQAAVDPTNSATWKPIVDFTCPTTASASVEFIAGAVRFDNILEMSNPERIANLMNAVGAVRARMKESRQLQIIDSLSHAYTFFGAYGALPTLIQCINTAVAVASESQRIDNPSYYLIVPRGVRQLLRIDRANRAFGVDMADSDLIAILRANLEGVTNVVESLDWSRGGEPGHPFAALNNVGDAASELATLDNDYRMRLVVPREAIYAETGAVNTGVVRDPSLMRMNKAQVFMEEGFLLARNGPSPWFSIDVGLCADGVRAGFSTSQYVCAPQTGLS